MLKRLAYGLAVLLSVFSCTSEETPQAVGKVTLRFSTGNMSSATKADLSDAQRVADGSAIAKDGSGNPDLVILIFENNDLKASYPAVTPPVTPPVITGELNSFSDGAVSVDASGNRTSFTPDEVVVTFSLPKAEKDYTVYCFANTTGLDWNETRDGENLQKWRLKDQGKEDFAKDILMDKSPGELDELKFEPLDGTLRPQRPELSQPDDIYTVTCMPLSAKGNLHVTSSGNGEVSLPLIRPVAKLTAIITNQTGDVLNLQNYEHSVNGIFAETGYLLEHTPDDYADDEPDDLSVSSAFIPLSQDGSFPYSWYVFPSEGPYTVDVAFTVGGTPNTFLNLPITNWRKQNILSLERNQHLIVSTRLSYGVTVSFNFEVQEWGKPITPSVHFD